MLFHSNQRLTTHLVGRFPTTQWEQTGNNSLSLCLVHRNRILHYPILGLPTPKTHYLVIWALSSPLPTLYKKLKNKSKFQLEKSWKYYLLPPPTTDASSHLPRFPFNGHLPPSTAAASSYPPPYPFNLQKLSPSHLSFCHLLPSHSISSLSFLHDCFIFYSLSWS